jgi:hypothetical protein
MFVRGSILAETPRPEAVRRHPRAPWLAVGVVCSGAFMGQLDVSIVTLTFRPMMREFHAPLAAGTQPRRSRIRPDRTVRYSGTHRRRSGRWRSVSLPAHLL